ncbi:MAG: DUF1573 domain-containing protein [Planctomycetota bacterium]|nr:DUF1573 domain-containing protein [Planctomycetota bacterium]
MNAHKGIRSLSRFKLAGALLLSAACVLAGPVSQTLAQAKAGPGTKEQDEMRILLKKKAQEMTRQINSGNGNISLPASVDANLAEGAAADVQPEAAKPAPAAPVGEGPRLVFDSNAHDFGTVIGTGPLVCKFPFKNLGTQKLVISAINTGCGCTAAKLAKMEFEPGEGDTIEITYSPKGSGKQQRAIQVASNDAAQPSMSIQIMAQVVPIVETRPQTVQFGQVNVGESRTLQLVVVSRDPDVQVMEVTSNNPNVVAELASPETKPEILVEPELPGVRVVNVTLKDSAAPGRVLATLNVKTSAAKDPGSAKEVKDLQTNAFAMVKGELTVNPPLLRVPPVVAGASFEREVIVTRAGNKPFQILAAEVANSTLPGVTVTTEPYKEGDVTGYKVKLKGQAGATANNFRGAVVLTTDLEREKTTEIQFSGIVRVPPPMTGDAPAPTTPPAPPAQAPKAN